MWENDKFSMREDKDLKEKKPKLFECALNKEEHNKRTYQKNLKIKILKEEI